MEEQDEKTECPECGETSVTTKFNTIDTWHSICHNEDCNHEFSLP